MFNWLNKVRRNRNGAVAVEFAVVLPFMVILLGGIIEVGWALHQASNINKGLKMGSLYLSRADVPMTADTQQTAENLVKTGTTDGSGRYLAGGWSNEGASLDITPRTFVINGTEVQVYRLEAAVPYDPLIGSMVPGLDLEQISLRLAHEQAHVGL